MSPIQDAERLEKLAADLRIMAANDGLPTLEQLMAAPTLDRWERATIPGYCLIGVVEGHPLNRPGLIKTSVIWTQGNGWVRTLNRFYKLGTCIHGFSEANS